MDYIITIPRKIDWKNYLKEVEYARVHDLELFYRVRYIPKDIHIGDRLYVTYNNKIRGYMFVSDFLTVVKPFVCRYSGKIWPSGNYICRRGKFHNIDGPDYKGFRGIRKYPI